MPIREELWAGRRVLLTGHTGFKGAWLSLWLQRLGAEVTGLAPSPPSAPSLYEAANVASGMAGEDAVDVRDAAAVAEAVKRARPEVVLHLAAQPMVRRSLIDPVSTFQINVIGTANVLDAVRSSGGPVRATVVVTSDKCYENDGGGRPFVEGDPLGGKDPYSASKACAEIVAASYRASYFADPHGSRLATARAGNVIGGGDWGEDRLLPDAVRVATGLSPAPLRVRNPDAVRPWQHVLNPLSGYLALAEALLSESEAGAESAAGADKAGADKAGALSESEAGAGSATGASSSVTGSATAEASSVAGSAAGAWNFGPDPADARPVGFVIERLRELWGGAPEWRADERRNPPEAGWLSLDSRKAQRELRWRPAWDLDRGLRALVSWHESHLAGQDMRAVSFEQIEQFVNDAG